MTHYPKNILINILNKFWKNIFISVNSVFEPQPDCPDPLSHQEKLNQSKNEFTFYEFYL